MGNKLIQISPDESDLVSMSTGTVAPRGVVKGLLKAFDVGEETCQTFKLTRLNDDTPSVKFHNRMTKQRLNTIYQQKYIPNERPKCGSEGRQNPL